MDPITILVVVLILAIAAGLLLGRVDWLAGIVAAVLLVLLLVILGRL